MHLKRCFSCGACRGPRFPQQAQPYLSEKMVCIGPQPNSLRSANSQMITFQFVNEVADWAQVTGWWQDDHTGSIFKFGGVFPVLGSSLFFPPGSGGKGSSICLPLSSGSQKLENLFWPCWPMVFKNRRTGFLPLNWVLKHQRTGSKNLPWITSSFVKTTNSMNFFINRGLCFFWFWKC